MMRQGLLLLACAFLCAAQESVEILRDRWGIPHVYAESEAAGFYGVGYAAAEDRIIQMELFRRRARGRLAEVFGERWVDSDRRFRVAGMGRYCDEAAAALPPDLRVYFTGYAAGVNAWMRANPERMAARFAKLGVAPERWREGDCICSWMAVAEVFDRLTDEGAVQNYREFRALAADFGEEEALNRRGTMIDDAAAVVSEAEMARNGEAYARLKARDRIPGHWFRSIPDELLRFSHAWAVGGARSETGGPLLESDPQVAVGNPPLWYEFHIAAGRFDVRGIAVAGAPGMLIGFNRNVAWGATALGAGSSVTFIEKLAPEGRGYLYRGGTLPFERRVETIEVKGAAPVAQEVLRTRHGFVFNSPAKDARPGEVYVSHYLPIEDRGTSLVGMLNMMGSNDWEGFRDAMQHYYGPGLHVVYADAADNIAYQTLVRVPLTRRTPRMALEGWTGEDEVMGRIPLDEMPHMLNPAAGFISHANNLPVGSWYPYDLGIGTGGVGHTSRSLRLMDLLGGTRRFSVETFESDVHRDDVNASIAALFPVARRLAAEERVERPVLDLLARLEGWDGRYRASSPAYQAAMALGGGLLPPFRQSPLGSRLGGGEGGISRLARLLREQYGSEGVPRDPDVRAYLMAWLRGAANTLQGAGRPSPDGEVHRMPYQAAGPLGFPSLDPDLDLVSPPLSCTQGGTVWSQIGNSYTQIVDLVDPDNSRTVLPPGISEDPESPHHTDQMEIWARGATHPAPLSRARVEEVTVSRTVLRVAR
jgi:penicillin G amidase